MNRRLRFIRSSLARCRNQEVFRAKFRGMEVVLLRCRLGEVWRNPGSGPQLLASPAKAAGAERGTATPGSFGTGAAQAKRNSGSGTARPTLTVSAPPRRGSRHAEYAAASAFAPITDSTLPLAKGRRGAAVVPDADAGDGAAPEPGSVHGHVR